MNRAPMSESKKKKQTNANVSTVKGAQTHYC